MWRETSQKTKFEDQKFTVAFPKQPQEPSSGKDSVTHRRCDYGGSGMVRSITRTQLQHHWPSKNRDNCQLKFSPQLSRCNTLLRVKPKAAVAMGGNKMSQLPSYVRDLNGRTS